MSVATIPVVKQLNFSGAHIDARLVQDVKDYHIQDRTIVINPNIEHVYVGEPPRKPIPPFSSTILVDTMIEQATSLILLQVKDETNLGNIILESGWELYGDTVNRMAGVVQGNSLPFPPHTPLWRSSQDDAGFVTFDPSHVLDQATPAQTQQKFQIKVNLWFATGHTNCFIHNQHPFIEVHTQVYGHGRMQKFKTQDYQTLYEDQLMCPGYTTHVPFCSVGLNETFVYPWHQYYAENECIWLAIEYHPTHL